MGIHGLTTYLRENKRILSKTIELSSSSPKHISIVVDGWSFIYGLYQQSGLPWVYGGEYPEFSQLVYAVVEAWIKIGFSVYFVFDGSCPEIKFPTVMARLSQSNIQPAQLFFHTSSISRSTPRFLNENRMLPPLSYSACLHALRKLQLNTDRLDIHFADEEGDPYAVELAGRIGGYVVGNDSDFVVLNSEGYSGYIPMDEMVWKLPLSEDAPSLDISDDEFQMVRKPKAKRKHVPDAKSNKGLIPPSGEEEISMNFTAYRPEDLASHLNIPVTLLPLLGALVGNDFSSRTNRNAQSMFFERNLSLTQRIESVARTIRSVLSPASAKRKIKHQVGSVMDLIDRTVNALLGHFTTNMSPGEIDAVVDKIVESTLQYAIPKYEGDLFGQEGLWATDVCALHEAETCTILPMISRNVMEHADQLQGENEGLLDARAQFLEAYRKGLIAAKTMDVLNSGTSWARLFLENPDAETVSRSIGRPIRQWVYAILNDSVGLPTAGVDDVQEDIQSSAASSEVAEESEEEEENSGDDDELIDVVESDDENDFLAPLKGELKRLHSDDEAPRSVTSQQSRKTSSHPVIVTEYIRRGTRIAQESVVMTPLPQLLSSINFTASETVPLTMMSEEDRLTVLLSAVKCNLPSVRTLPPERLVAVLALHWTVHTLGLRALETGSKERDKEKWTKGETRCFLASFGAAAAAQAEPPQIVDRNVQITAQILMAMESIEQLAEVLLLSHRAPSAAPLFSGRVFHSYLTGINSFSDADIPTDLWNALEESLKDAFQEERTKKPKKDREVAVAQAVKSKVKPKASGGLFSVLAEMDG